MSNRWGIFASALLLKLLLVPSYHSTDFEVHRNWLAITHTLPVGQWYYEATSEWTLDYPPFFAWFERALASLAPLFDAQMLDLAALGYASPETVLFQRLTVMATEAVYFAGILRMLRAIRVPSQHETLLLLLAFMSPGIIFVDHIHFQYNAFMYGIQLFSVACMFEGRHILGGALFAIVLNFKHIYLYQAPAYFVYLLAGFCFTAPFKFSIVRLASLGAVVVAVFAVSFGPFAQHIPQVLSRLFPFKRGLCHAYWAPNFWALYSFADRVLLLVLGRRGGEGAAASLTRGLVGDSVFSVLPNISPMQTVLLTVTAQLPILARLWTRPTPHVFLDSLILCGFGSYLFGWHVHEKAILMVLIPMSFAAIRTSKFARVFIVTAVSGFYSLFPLLFERQELITKSVILLLYSLCAVHFVGWATRPFSLSVLERLYLAGFFALLIYTELVHSAVFGQRLAFLPLMATSVYCSLGIVYGWFGFYALALSRS